MWATNVFAFGQFVRSFEPRQKIERPIPSDAGSKGAHSGQPGGGRVYGPGQAVNNAGLVKYLRMTVMLRLLEIYSS